MKMKVNHVLGFMSILMVVTLSSFTIGTDKNECVEEEYTICSEVKQKISKYVFLEGDQYSLKLSLNEAIEIGISEADYKEMEDMLMKENYNTINTKRVKYTNIENKKNVVAMNFDDLSTTEKK